MIGHLSFYEASEFWGEHDFGEFNDFTETDEIQFSLKKKQYVGIDHELFGFIHAKAKELQKTEEKLINEWLSEKIGL